MLRYSRQKAEVQSNHLARTGLAAHTGLCLLHIPTIQHGPLYREASPRKHADTRHQDFDPICPALQINEFMHADAVDSANQEPSILLPIHQGKWWYTLISDRKTLYKFYSIAVDLGPSSRHRQPAWLQPFSLSLTSKAGQVSLICMNRVPLFSPLNLTRQKMHAGWLGMKGAQ